MMPGTPDYGNLVSEELLADRNTSPDMYPCIGDADGVYKPTDLCRKPCCVTPAMTPDGEDSPKWLRRQLQGDFEDEEPARQPDFGAPDMPDDEVETPFKNHKAPASGTTPEGAFVILHRYNSSANGCKRCKKAIEQPGVPGWHEEEPIKLFKE